MMLKNQNTITFEDYDLRHYTEPEDTANFIYHDFFEISLMVSGIDEVLINQELSKLTAKDLFVADIFERHKYRNIDATHYERYCLQVLPEFAMQYCTYNINLLPNFRLQSGNTIHKINLSNEQFKILHSKFKRYEEIKGIYGEEMLKRLCVIEILIYVSGFFKNNAPNSEHVSGECVTNILPIIHFINENITEDLCLDMIASEVHMNKSYLCKLFNKCTGTTINSYISKKRITKAKTLLLQNIPATEVSLDVGFNDYSTFSRAFKEDVGCSPSFYLKYLAESKK